MVSLLSLWLPIALSAVIVFLASSIIHMALGYHANDFQTLAKEDEIMAALRPFEIPPGDYSLPHASSMAAMKDPAFKAKMDAGPVATMTVGPKGQYAMGSAMLLWFVYSLVVGVFAAYLTGHALAPGAQYLEVFRFVGTTAFLGYALALLQFSIWYRRRWSTTLLSVFDGLIYALLTAGTFGWLWPK
ncbi:MAG: hypothetical protein ABI609_04620 [Acidobacteriota bacterium]